MQELRELLAGRTDQAPLDVAALQIATIEYPEISVEPFLVLLDSYATEFSERVTSRTSGEEFVQTLNEFLFDELGFRGNAEDYYSPANSCLNEVLTKREGIPITLSLVYMEVARRLDRRIHGIGLPGHFLVQFAEPDFQMYIDPFHSGQLLLEDDCYDLARSATGREMPHDPSILQPVTKQHIALRMLNNLRSAYFRSQEVEKAIGVLNLFIEAFPSAAEEYKQRGICYAQIDDFVRAQADLETYIHLLPAASDRKEVEAKIRSLRRGLQ